MNNIQYEAKESTSLENSIPIPTQTLELLEKLDRENVKLRKENAKLRCLALHAMSQYYGYKSLFSSRKKTHRIKYEQFSYKFYEAYCRAKKALKEGK